MRRCYHIPSPSFGMLSIQYWLDYVGDVHWNQAAEREMYRLLLAKQFPQLSNSHEYPYKVDDYINDCEYRHFILLEQ